MDENEFYENTIEKPKLLLALPRLLEVDDTISMKFQILGPEVLKIGFVCGLVSGCIIPDYRNIAYQLEIHFSTKNQGEVIRIIAVDNEKTKLIYETPDKENPTAHQFFVQDTLSMMFKLTKNLQNSDNLAMSVTIADVFKTNVELFHSKKCLRFLSFNEEAEAVKSLKFEFTEKSFKTEKSSSYESSTDF